jgi:hypothetical protein
MRDNEHRRKSKRHQINWKAAVVFDESDQRPILYTQTTNLSIGGVAIVSDYGDLTGCMVTLLLGLQSQNSDAPKMLMLSSCVVSTTRAPTESRYQHGLRFDNLDRETVELLGSLIDGKESVPVSNAANAQVAAMMPATWWESRRLAALKQRVLSRQLELEKPNSEKQNDEKVSLAIEKTYRYLEEFTDRLNTVKPEYAKPYSINGVPNFDGLVWEMGQVSCIKKEILPGTRQFEQVTLVFKLSGSKSLYVTQEPPADDALKTLLSDTKIEFTTREERNDHNTIVKTLFEIPCEVLARLELIGNFDTGKLLLRTRNIERFGMMDYELDPTAISDDLLDELSEFIRGENINIGPLLLTKT